MTAQEGAVLATDKATEELIFMLSLTDEDRLRWQPAETARDTLNIFAECVVVTENWAKCMDLGAHPSPFDPERFRRRLAELELQSKDELVTELQRAVKGFNEAVLRLPDEELQTVIKTPWDEAPVASWLGFVAAHNSYHCGQIAYIQTAYGKVGYE